MENFKKAWNYGTPRKRKDEPEKKEEDEEKKSMTVREHMTQ